ncbi:MAG: peptidase M24, partial [Puniceicoccaceae bacterium]|nr:peptidase M24 [Puniceicoccaceae bacterium]
LVQTVRKAHKIAVGKIKAGVSSNSIHNLVCQCFDQAGYPTRKRRDSGAFEGFIHSTGHGLGLDIHESPRVGPSKNRLIRNQVITIEPGLYYPDLGACRIEDVYVVTKEGANKLSQFNYRWEIA